MEYNKKRYQISDFVVDESLRLDVFDKRILAHFDFVQLIFIIPILVLSHILISEANEILAFKQYIYYALGFGVFLFFFIIPFRKLEWIIPFFYWFGIVLLISVDLFGVSKLGAKRWLEIRLSKIINYVSI